jgi:CheY-like chemotaxis protein
VTTAENGKIAYDIFTQSKQGTFDVILMDIMMPVMNGFDATKAIRESDHPEAKTIPIIAMTANAFAEDVTASLEAGMNAHIAKPINIPMLLSVLNSYRDNE